MADEKITVTTTRSDEVIDFDAWAAKYVRLVIKIYQRRQQAEAA